MNLNDFFVQLYESEKRAKQRKEQLSEIQQEIKDTEIKIKEAGEEEINLKGHLAVRLQSLSEEEINLKWIRNKESIMKEQLHELKEKIDSQITKKNKLLEECNKQREEFMTQVGDFVSNFGLSCNRKKIRDVEATEKLESLRNDKEILSKELQQLKHKQRESEDIEEEKTTILEEVKAYRKKLKDLDVNLESAKEKTKQIITEKHQLAKKPENGQEFKRLQQELEVCRSDSLEGLCQALQPEVDRLQRQAWQRRIQRPMVAVPPTNQKTTFTPTFMPQRKSNSYPTRYGMLSKPVTVATKSCVQLVHQSSSGSKVTQSGQWTNGKMSMPADSANTEEFNLEETDNQLNEPDNDITDPEETDIIEDILISDDELITEDGISRPVSADNSVPQKAKRVRFQ